jgi:hypothetical protein
VPCASWRATAADRYSGLWDRRTANPVLVLNTTFDPSTPYEGAVAMSQQLARARLLTVDGYGHGAQGAPSACVVRHINRYLDLHQAAAGRDEVRAGPAAVQPGPLTAPSGQQTTSRRERAA